MIKIFNLYITSIVILLLLHACLSTNNEPRVVGDGTVILSMEVSHATLPGLYATDKKLYFSWIDTVSMPGKSKFSIAELRDTTLYSPVTLAVGENWFINWADYPSMVVNGNHVLAHFLANSPGTNKMAYDIKYGVQDLATPSEHFQLLNTDGTQSEHGFVSMLPLTDTSFFITWLDGRNMAGGHDDQHSGHTGAMNVRAAEVNLYGKVRSEVILDHMACTCCQTTAALTSSGPVVLYRDCTIDNIRDIVITRKIGEDWTEPRPVHLDGWKIEGCPVNGPKADATGDTIVVAWFTGAQGKAKVNVAFSFDAGATFSVPRTVSNTYPLGRVDVKMLDSNQAIVSWMESQGDQTFLYAQRVASDLTIPGKPVKIAKVSSSRKSGFPQMEIMNDKVYFAWTDPERADAVVKITQVPLHTL